jgi:hypothetical protein
MEKEKSKAKAKSRSLETDLMAALHFTQADLDANRDGQLSEEQRARLYGKRIYWLLAIVGVVAFIFLINLPGVFVVFGSGDYPPPVKLLIFIGFILGCIGILVVLYDRSRLRAIAADLQDKTVEAEQGLISLETFGQNKMTARINDIEFTLNAEAGLAFKNGDPYCLYYAPHSKTLLSAEWLRED